MSGGGDFVLGQSGAVIFHGPWGLWVSKALLCVTYCSINVSGPGCDSLSTSKPSGFLTPFLTPFPTAALTLLLWAESHLERVVEGIIHCMDIIIRWHPSQAQVAQTCNPSNLGGRDKRGLCLEASPGKKFARPSTQPIAGHSGSSDLSSQLCRRLRSSGHGSMKARAESL
jgi:hypothetical protein